VQLPQFVGNDLVFASEPGHGAGLLAGMPRVNLADGLRIDATSSASASVAQHPGKRIAAHDGLHSGDGDSAPK
jgi:hypothetical protein